MRQAVVQPRAPVGRDQRVERQLARRWPPLPELDDAGMPCGPPRGGCTGWLRKNHYGSKSPHGTAVAATLYTVLETAELHGIDPAKYLLQAARAASSAWSTLAPRCSTHARRSELA